MFELSIWKLMIIGAVALIVIGPDRLPEVARTAGRWFGRLQRYVANVKADINREIEASEFNKVKSEFQTAAREIEHNVNHTISSAENEMQALNQNVADVDIHNTDLIANDPALFDGSNATTTPHLPIAETVAATMASVPVTATVVATSATPLMPISTQGKFDFGYPGNENRESHDKHSNVA